MTKPSYAKTAQSFGLIFTFFLLTAESCYYQYPVYSEYKHEVARVYQSADEESQEVASLMGPVLERCEQNKLKKCYDVKGDVAPEWGPCLLDPVERTVYDTLVTATVPVAVHRLCYGADGSIVGNDRIVENLEFTGFAYYAGWRPYEMISATDVALRGRMRPPQFVLDYSCPSDVAWEWMVPDIAGREEHSEVANPPLVSNHFKAHAGGICQGEQEIQYYNTGSGVVVSTGY